MKKRLTISAIFSVFTALVIGSMSATFNNAAQKVDAGTTVESQISSVQIRSGGSGANYLVILDSLIDPSGPSMTVSSGSYNALSHVNLYMSPTGEAISLSTIVNSSDSWTLNLWTCGGIMFPICDENFEIYNGATVYSIEVLEGCTYPNQNFGTVEVPATHKYLNSNYGNLEAKNEAFAWSDAFVPSETTIEISNGQVRADPSCNFYNVCLVSSVFNGVEALDYPNLYEINAYSKIKLYLSESDTGTYLSNITSLRAGAQNRWGSSAFLFALTAAEYEIYNGQTTYKIEVEAGCQLVLNNTIVTISESYSLINSNYGDASYKDGAFYFMPDTDPIPETITLCDAQVRADDENAFYFIDVRSDSYAGTPVIEYDNLGDLNTYSHIKIYLSNKGEGVLLSDVTTLRRGYQNLWTSGAMLFALTAAEYEIYNGTTIYRIEVLEGCQLFLNNSIVTVDRRYSYVNADYGKASAKWEAFNFSEEEEGTPLANLGNIEVSGIHNRMDKDSGYRWVMFLFSGEVFNEALDVSLWMEELNTLDNILIYFSEDGTPVTLREIYDPSTSGVSLQLFGQKNMMAVSISNEKTNGKYLYSGPEMYKITIKEKTQIPNLENGVEGYRLVQEEISFINADYQKYGEIPDDIDDEGHHRIYEEWSINWTVEIDGLRRLGEVGISTIHNRMDKDSGYRWIMIMLDTSLYEVSLNVSEWMEELNFLESISIYFSEDGEPILLKDIYDPTTTTGVTIQLFSQKNMIAVSISNEKEGDQYKYCGPNMFKMVIEAGTQIPTYENGVAGYREVRSKTVLLNDDYHLSGDIDGTMDDYGNPRIYEEWNINWTVASCLVTFKVEGIENVTYPDLLLDYGQRVPLEKYQISGYDLVATTDAGETIYQCIIGTNHNINVILTYTKSAGGGNQGSEEEKPKGFWAKLKAFFKKIGDAFKKAFSKKNKGE